MARGRWSNEWPDGGRDGLDETGGALVSGRTVGVYLTEETYERAISESKRTGVSIGKVCAMAVEQGLEGVPMPEGTREAMAVRAMNNYRRLEAHLEARKARAAIDIGGGEMGWSPGFWESVEGLLVELESARVRWESIVKRGVRKI